MSWKDKIENGIYKITTGDGKTYTPLWKPGESTKEFNYSSYNFINLKGTFIDRKNPESAKYPLVFWFQGEDHIELTDAFFNSADDPRAWEIDHPQYGIISGQPLSIKKNDVNYNITEITVDFWESISVDYPEEEISIQDRISSKSLNLKSLGVVSFSSSQPEASNIQTLKESANQTKGTFNNITDEDKVSYDNAYSKALKFAEKVVSSKEESLAAQQDLLTLPVSFSSSSFTKIDKLDSVLETLSGLIENTTDKYFYESQGALAISSSCECAVNPLEGDYVSRTDIETVSEKILKSYDSYLGILDQQQVGQYQSNTFNPDPQLQIALKNLVVETIGNLQLLAFDAKQERIVFAEKNTNLILVTHRYLGLASDENLNAFRNLNKIRNDEVFQIKKGRELRYFI